MIIEDVNKKLIAFAAPINPEPWAIGNTSVVRNKKTGKTFPKIAPNFTMKQYQEALRSELEGLCGRIEDGYYTLRMWFWREVHSYTSTKGSKQSRNKADGTNLLKSTEDALQGYLIDNDANVLRADWIIVEQGKDVEPMVGIEVRYGIQLEEDGEYVNGDTHKFDMSTELLQCLVDASKPAARSEFLTDNEWKG